MRGRVVVVEEERMVEEVESSPPPHPLLQALRDITQGRGGVEGGGGVEACDSLCVCSAAWKLGCRTCSDRCMDEAIFFVFSTQELSN